LVGADLNLLIVEEDVNLSLEDAIAYQFLLPPLIHP
jgi:hypothetical protein